MRKFVAVLALTFGATLLAPTSPAAADTPGCVTLKEAGTTMPGMVKSRVHALFDTSGRRVVSTPKREVRNYRVCKSWNDTAYGFVQVHYRKTSNGTLLRTWRA